MQATRQHQPIFNAPLVVVCLAGIFVAVHVLLQVLPQDTGDWLFVALAVVPARLTMDVSVIPGGPVAAWTSFVTHAFVHGDWGHLFINTAWLLVFGSIIAKRSGAVRMLAMFVVTGIAGSGLYVLLHQLQLGSLVGASGGLSGLMGGVMRFLFTGIDAVQSGRAVDAAQAPLPSLRQSLGDKRVLAAVGSWLAINLVFGLFPAGVIADGAIAWEAHLGGFVAGFLSMALFDRPRRAMPGQDASPPSESA